MSQDQYKRGIAWDASAVKILLPGVERTGLRRNILTLCGLYTARKSLLHNTTKRPLDHFGEHACLTYIMQGSSKEIGAVSRYRNHRSTEPNERSAGTHIDPVDEAIRRYKGQCSLVTALYWLDACPPIITAQMAKQLAGGLPLPRTRNLVQVAMLDPYDPRMVPETVLLSADEWIKDRPTHTNVKTTTQLYTFMLHGPLRIPSSERIWSSQANGTLGNLAVENSQSKDDLLIGEARLTVALQRDYYTSPASVQLVSCVAWDLAGAPIENIDHYEVIRLIYASLGQEEVEGATERAIEAMLKSGRFDHDGHFGHFGHDMLSGAVLGSQFCGWLKMGSKARWMGLDWQRSPDTDRIVCQIALLACIQVVIEDQKNKIQHSISPALALTPRVLCALADDEKTRELVGHLVGPEHTKAALDTLIAAYICHGWAQAKGACFVLPPDGRLRDMTRQNSTVWDALAHQASIDQVRAMRFDEDFIAREQKRWCERAARGEQEGAGEQDMELWAKVRGLVHDICQASTPLLFPLDRPSAVFKTKGPLKLDDIANSARAADSLLTLLSLPLCEAQRLYASSQVFRLMFAAERKMQPSLFDAIAPLVSTKSSRSNAPWGAHGLEVATLAQQGLSYATVRTIKNLKAFAEGGQRQLGADLLTHLKHVVWRLALESSPDFYGTGVNFYGVPFDRGEKFWTKRDGYGEVLVTIDGMLLGRCGYPDRRHNAAYTGYPWEEEDIIAITARAMPCQPIMAGLMRPCPRVLYTSANGVFLSPEGKEEQVAQILQLDNPSERGVNGPSGTLYDPTPAQLLEREQRYDKFVNDLQDDELFCVLQGEQIQSGMSTTDVDEWIGTPTPLHHGARAVHTFATAAEAALYQIAVDMGGLADAVWAKVCDPNYDQRPPTDLLNFKPGFFSLAITILYELRSMGIYLPTLQGCEAGTLRRVLIHAVEHGLPCAASATKVLNNLRAWDEHVPVSFDRFFAVFFYSLLQWNREARGEGTVTWFVGGLDYTMLMSDISPVFGYLINYLNSRVEPARQYAVGNGEPDRFILACGAIACTLLAGCEDAQPIRNRGSVDGPYGAHVRITGEVNEDTRERMELESKIARLVSEDPTRILDQDYRRQLATHQDSNGVLYSRLLDLTFEAHMRLDDMIGVEAGSGAEEWAARKLNELHAQILRALFVLWADGRFVARAHDRVDPWQDGTDEPPDHRVYRTSFNEVVAFDSHDTALQWDELLERIDRGANWPAIAPKRSRYADMNDWWNAYAEKEDEE